ncbi:MAG: uracil-DNA glycosylase [Clostridiales bacterium]|nr:uracil-DNA glycosylase [Clostridiales bacterium]
MNDDWQRFIDTCKNCNACGLRQYAKNVVVYRGGLNAPLMVIGEGPGEQEDIKGLPFVGPSGMLLQNLLASYGLEGNNSHICNIVKCRPPNNRRPEPSEIRTCKQHLAAQFRLVRPKVILLCGSVAYEAFFGVKPVMREIRGVFIEKNGYYIMTTFHPAFALRNPQAKIPLYEDVGKVRELLEKLGELPPLEND